MLKLSHHSRTLMSTGQVVAQRDNRVLMTCGAHRACCLRIQVGAAQLFPSERLPAWPEARRQDPAVRTRVTAAGRDRGSPDLHQLMRDESAAATVRAVGASVEKDAAIH